MTSTLPPDPYKTLGVTQDAQITEIRSAHRKLVLKCHPDKVQDPTLKAQKQDEFQRVQEAYELLSNEKERQRYDDQVRLAELRKQMQAKSNSSAPRSTPYKYEVRTPEPRPSSFKSSTATPTSAKFSRSYEGPSGTRIYEDISIRRERSYESKSSSKKEEREREQRRSEKEKERKKKDKEAKEAEEYLREKVRKAEKKARDKQKRAEEERKRHANPYIEDDLEEIQIREKKKSSKKHSEKRERSSHREEMPSVPPPPMPPMPKDEKSRHQIEEALRHISSKNVAFRHLHNPPAAPTPPMPAGQSSPFPPPGDEDEVRHSATKSRRGSSGRKASQEVLSDPEIVDVSPSARYAQKKATGDLTGSPPRRDLPRQNTMPASDGYSRPMPSMTRAATFAGAYPSDPRGRARSRLDPQVSVESDEDDYDERRHRSERKHRSKKQRSPEPTKSYKYKVEGNRAMLREEYSRSFEQPSDSYSYYSQNYPAVRVDERHHHSSADYGTAGVPYKVKTSKSFNPEDVSYSHHYQPYDNYEYAAYA